MALHIQNYVFNESFDKKKLTIFEVLFDKKILKYLFADIVNYESLCHKINLTSYSL